ncbi:hypothetical protein ABK040_005512 [Willaertia magna]
MVKFLSLLARAKKIPPGHYITQNRELVNFILRYDPPKDVFNITGMIPDKYKSLVTYNYLITTCLKYSNLSLAKKLFQELVESGKLNLENLKNKKRVLAYNIILNFIRICAVSKDSSFTVNDAKLYFAQLIIIKMVTPPAIFYMLEIFRQNFEIKKGIQLSLTFQDVIKFEKKGYLLSKILLLCCKLTDTKEREEYSSQFIEWMRKSYTKFHQSNIYSNYVSCNLHNISKALKILKTMHDKQLELPERLIITFYVLLSKKRADVFLKYEKNKGENNESNNEKDGDWNIVKSLDNDLFWALLEKSEYPSYKEFKTNFYHYMEKYFSFTPVSKERIKL